MSYNSIDCNQMGGYNKQRMSRIASYPYVNNRQYAAQTVLMPKKGEQDDIL